MNTARLLSVEMTGLTQQPILTALNGIDYLSAPFHFDLTCVSEVPLEASTLLGSALHVSIGYEQQQKYHGLIDTIVFQGRYKNGYFTYQLSVVPWVKQLDRVNNYRLFQNQSIDQIVHELLRTHHCADYTFQLHQDYPVYPYMVQYNETDWHFIQRLFDQVGIYYYFEHQADQHRLVMSDHRRALAKFDQPTVACQDVEQADQCFHAWEDHNRQQQFHAFSQQLFDSRNTTHQFIETVKSKDPQKHFAHDTYGEHIVGLSAEAQRHMLKQKLQTEEAKTAFAVVQSNYLGLYPGLSLDIHHQSQGKRLKNHIYAIQHRATDTSQIGHEHQKIKQHYHNTVRLYPQEAGLYPGVRFVESGHFKDEKPLVKPLAPNVSNRHSAIVTGLKGARQYHDDNGSVKVQFPWDRYGYHNEHSSGWLPVLDHWAGDQRGLQFLPRIGDEVLIDFEFGDPNRPLVTGSLYNTLSKPPFDQPLQSGFKTQTESKDQHQVQFDDTPSHASITIHSAGDFHLSATHDSQTMIGGDATMLIEQGDYVHEAGDIYIEAKDQIRIGTDEAAIIIEAGGISFIGNSIVFERDPSLIPPPNR